MDFRWLVSVRWNLGSCLLEKKDHQSKANTWLNYGCKAAFSTNDTK